MNFTPVIMLIERVPITGNGSAEKLLWNAKGLANVGRKVGNLSGERVKLLSDCLCVIDRDQAGKNQIGEVVLDRVDRVELELSISKGC